MFWVLVFCSLVCGPVAVLVFLRRYTSLAAWLREDGALWRLSWIPLLAGVLLVLLTLGMGYQRLFVQGHANLLLHFVGGGMATSLVFEYWMANLKPRLTLIDRAALLLLVACTLGVGAELLEWLLDTLSGTVAYSSDRWDTWRDLGADLSGAYSGWIMIETVRHLAGPRHRRRA